MLQEFEGFFRLFSSLRATS